MWQVALEYDFMESSSRVRLYGADRGQFSDKNFLSV